VLASISGTLCRSEACEAKLDNDKAAVKVDRTQERYGRRDWDYISVSVARRLLASARTNHSGRPNTAPKYRLVLELSTAGLESFHERVTVVDWPE
jgi:hypothetical protein